MSFTLQSPDFNNNQNIPKQFTCEGDNITPTLKWQDIPDRTQSLVLIVDDPDAPSGEWVHWIVFNIPGTSQQISNGHIPAGAVMGQNSWGKSEYGGPCPPSGTHHYFFKLYALDTKLDLSEQATKDEVDAGMQKHIIAQTQLIGLYKKHGN